jgi:hypothetical protein
MKFAGKTLALLTIALFLATPCYAINIAIDYSHDTFFASHPVAMAALEAAAADVSSAITTTLNATVDTNSSTVNGSSVTFDFRYIYENPTTGAEQIINSAVMPANEFRIFVGVRNLTGITLGTGGPGAAGLSAGGGSANFADFTTAVNNAAAAGSANMQRGGGATIATLSGALNVPGQGSAPFSIDFGSTVGNLWFDVDSDNNGAADNDVALDAYWHYDHTAPVAAGKNDLYSVAIHEILHSLGVGASKSWTSKVSGGDDWTGAEVIAQIGSGVNILEADSKHIVGGKVSTRISDGAPQEAVMDPSITTGNRKSLTNLDLAFLRDIGWQTIAYKSALHAGDFDGDGDVDGADFISWQSNFPKISGAGLGQGEGDGDGDVDGADLAIWRTNFPHSPGSGVAPVPELATGFNAVLGGLACAAFVFVRGRRYGIIGSSASI